MSLSLRSAVNNRPRPLLLVVDDDDDFRLPLVAALDRHGYWVVSATDGEDAMRVVENGALPSLVLLDLQMPGMDGWCFRHELELLEPGLNIPIIVMTGWGAQSAELLNVRQVLQKPFDVEGLLAVVSDALGGATGLA